MSEAEIIRLDLPASYKYLNVLGACIHEVFERQEGLKDSEIVSYNVQLAVQETCTNIVGHAYEESEKSLAENRILVELIITPGRLVVELRDTGRPFDFDTVKEPDLERAQVHGYGIYLIKTLMDQVDYISEPGFNLWRLIKNL